MLLTGERHDDLLTFAIRAMDARLYTEAEFYRFAGMLRTWLDRAELITPDRPWASRLLGDERRYTEMSTQELTALASKAQELPWL